MSVVVGGGISGLAASHYLLKNSHQKVKLLEASQRLGGWIQSTSLPNGLVFEQGPRTIRPKGEQGINTLSLIEELGLADKVIPIASDHPASLNRLVYVNGHLHKLPSNLMSLFFSKPPFTRPLVTSIFRDFKTPKKIKNDESVYDFVERRLGKELADYAISPMICGICAGDAKEISVKFLMKTLFEAEQNHGSIIRGLFQNYLNKGPNKPSKSINNLSQRALDDKWSVWSLKGGLEELPKALKESIKEGVDIRINTSCLQIRFTDAGKAMVKTNDGEYQCDHVYSSIPACQLAPLIKLQHPDLAKDLAAIPMVTVAVVNLLYSEKVLDQEAFGFLIPPAENLPILGVIYDSCCFPKGDSTVLTVMMGGKWFNKWFGGNPPPGLLLSTAATQLEQILGITVKPQTSKTHVLKDCIPQYIVGHQERVERMRKYIKKCKLPLSLIGSSYDGVGVNDVIMSAKKAVESDKLTHSSGWSYR